MRRQILSGARGLQSQALRRSQPARALVYSPEDDDDQRVTPTIKLVLMRHGQSSWNAANRFTGWADIGLTSEGEDQASRAGAVLRSLNFEFDVCFTSMLKRSVRSAWILLGEAQQHWVPVQPSWRLNERHYGALTGMSKSEATSKLGHDMVMGWRRSWGSAPPPIQADHPLFNSLVDRRYAGVLGSGPSEIPSTESLEHCSHRVVHFYEHVVKPALYRGQRPLVVAHAHTIRAIIKHLDQIPDDDIESLTIPTGVPLIYSLDQQTLEPVRRRAMVDVQAFAEELGNDSVENSAVVPTESLSTEAAQRHIEGVPYQPIRVCNKSWRILSGPGITEDVATLSRHRRVVDDLPEHSGMVYLTDSLLSELKQQPRRGLKDAEL